METMLKYGIFKEWDETIRAQALIERIRKEKIGAQVVASPAVAHPNMR